MTRPLNSSVDMTTPARRDPAWRGRLCWALAALAGRFIITGHTAAALARNIQLFDYMLIGLVIFIWTAALTVTIGCIIVWLMKGPAYVADGFEVSHSDQPKP